MLRLILFAVIVLPWMPFRIDYPAEEYFRRHEQPGACRQIVRPAQEIGRAQC